MGEYIPASIQFGGKLKEEHVDELIALLEAEGLQADWCESPERENLSACFANAEVNYGNLDELVAFGRTHGLHYVYWFDNGPEWEATTERYYPDLGESWETVGEGAIREADVRRLGSYAAIIDHFERAKAPVPPLEIVP